MPILDSDRFEARLREATRRGLLGDALAFAAAPVGPPGVATRTRQARTEPPTLFGSLTPGDPARATPMPMIGRNTQDDRTEDLDEHHNI